MGRDNQKRRTRRGLVQAAGRLVAAGQRPTVDEVADAAEVSRRTAYRYFTNAEQLKVEAILEALRPRMEAAIDAGSPAESIDDRLDRLVSALHELTMDNEPLLRQLIRSTVDRSDLTRGSSHRSSRRLEYVQQALGPLHNRLGSDQFDRLTYAITVVLGMEATIVLRDVCELESDQIVDVERWAAHALLHAALCRPRRDRRNAPIASEPQTMGPGDINSHLDDRAEP